MYLQICKPLKQKLFFCIVIAAGCLLICLYHHYAEHSGAMKSTSLKKQRNIRTSLVTKTHSIKNPPTTIFMLDKEILDKNSPYFDLIYKNLYGTSSKYEPIKPEVWFDRFSKNLPSWTNFMPQTQLSIQQYKRHNPKQNQTRFTSSNTYVTLMKQGPFRVGEEFVAQLHAKDSLNRSKQFGGDYFRAVLVNNSTSSGLYRDGIPCSVQDHLNGYYTLRAPLIVPGVYVLEVILCASVELISTYVEWADNRIREGFIFDAFLESNETVKCNSDLLLYDEYKNQQFCNYSNPRNGEPYFCTSPPSGICSPIKNIIPSYLNSDPKGLNFQKPFNNIPKLNMAFNKDQPVSGSGSYLKVLPENSVPGTKQKYLLTSSNSGSLQPNGYSNNGRWVSFTHNYTWQRTKDYARCFSNKLVYLLGDSTMRQFFLLSEKSFKLNVTQSHPTTSYHHQLQIGVNKEHNISIYFRAHGLPIRLTGPPSLSPYITDLISTLKTGGPHVVLIITLGLHHIEYHPVFYIHRLIGIQKALIKHFKKFPHTKVIIKGLNVSTVRHLPFEWMVLRYNTILKNIFEQVKQVVFADLWDMTTVWPLSGYHPPIKILEDQANIMFSKFC